MKQSVYAILITASKAFSPNYNVIWWKQNAVSWHMDDLVMWNECGIKFTVERSISATYWKIRFAYGSIVTISFSWPFVSIFAFFASSSLPLFLIMLHSFLLHFFLLSLFHSFPKEIIDHRISKLKGSSFAYTHSHTQRNAFFGLRVIHSFQRIISFRLKRIENQFNAFTVNSF